MNDDPPQTSNVIHNPPIFRRAPNRLASFSYAFAGIGYLFRTQRNAQIHSAISIMVIVAGVLFRIERLEWLAIVLTIMLVLAAEGINTAIEAVVDLASPQRHPLAKIAKDVAAGTVLITAIGAVVVGILIFMPRIWPFVANWLAWR
jgi:diacylglycerol kinase (ATP)